MTPVLAAALAFHARWAPPAPDLTIATIRLHPADYHAVLADPELDPLRDPAVLVTDPPGPDGHLRTELGDRRGLLGMQLILDHEVPAGQWRVCAADGRLIRDSRSTNEV